MPRPTEPKDRSPEQRAADHASLATLAEGLVPALVARLGATGLGELEIREGDWTIRVRRPPGAGLPAGRRPERLRSALHPGDRHGPARDGVADARSAAVSPPVEDDPAQAVATSPAVGVFRPSARPGSRVAAGDRIGIVDLLGIPQDVVAPIDGTLTEILVEAGSAVEYGEPVAVVEAPAGSLAIGEG